MSGGYAALAALLLLLAGCGEAAPPAALGSPAPDYAAVTLDGDSVSLAGLDDRVVLLNVWATWCHPCRTEIPALQALHERYAARGLELVGVSVDTRGEDQAIRRFAREFGMSYPIWLDPDARVSSVFGAIGVPSTYLIDRAGIVRWKHVGPVREDDATLTRAIEQAL